jgi:transposase-like protein
MMAAKKVTIGLVAGLVLVWSGSGNGVHAGLLRGNSQAPKQDGGQTPPTTPEAQAATARVDRAKANLDQARKQLEAAKAVLKAADAEFRAARADSQALSLRTQAQRLADSSGLAGSPMDRVPSLQNSPDQAFKPASFLDKTIKPANAGADPQSSSTQGISQGIGEERIDPIDNAVGQDSNSLGAPSPQ